MFKKLKIRQKFLLIGIIVFFSLLILGWLSYRVNKQNYINLSSVFSDFSIANFFETSYIEPLFLLREKSLSLCIDNTMEDYKQVEQEMLAVFKKIDALFKHRSIKIQKNWNAYKEQFLLTRKFIKNKQKTIAYKNITTIERMHFLNLIKSLKEEKQKGLINSESTYLSAIDDSSKSEYYIIIGFLIIGFFSFLFNISVVRKIINAIEKMESGMKRFLSYLTNPKQAKHNVTIDINTKDELGIMAKAINKQVIAIKVALEKDYYVIEEATKTLNELHEGKFGTRLTSHASSQELDTLKNVMNKMMDDLEGKIQEEIDKRLAQDQILVQQAKLAAMGNMLGNIAHQWRQPISEISSVLMGIETMLRYEDINKEKFLQNINLCNQITEHMSHTISDFQNFFKPSKQKEYFDVYEECEKAVAIISASFDSYKIELEFNINQSNTIYGYPREFAHSILNILSNAKDIILERKIQNPKVIFTIKTGKEYTLIHIEDNAGGIHLKNINQVFEPYFTTKHAKQGTGIGLHMTKTMIENNMHGYINVHNTKQGACFTIKIK